MSRCGWCNGNSSDEGDVCGGVGKLGGTAVDELHSGERWQQAKDDAAVGGRWAVVYGWG